MCRKLKINKVIRVGDFSGSIRSVEENKTNFCDLWCEIRFVS